MKYVIRIIPTILLLLFVFALVAHVPPACSAQDREIRQELKRLSARLDQLEKCSRGCGSSTTGKTGYPRNFSNQLFFLTDTPGVLKHAQATATLGFVYW